MSISPKKSKPAIEESFDSPWRPRYEVQSASFDAAPSFDVVDLKFDVIVARCPSRSKADLECAILTLEHLRTLRSEKLKRRP